MTATISRFETIPAEIVEAAHELVLRGLHIRAEDGVITLTAADLGGFRIDRYTVGEEREEMALALEDNGYRITWDGGHYGVHSLTRDTHGFLTHLQRVFTDTGYDL